ncbi:C-type natriuretic peptide 2 [Colossoma macropomum]|uniref:C-type natriuretic peptide 2 n=1 Tax=Colossoma macropomum TaxID=42526 RepID=UPI001864CD9D|nr:C-type natriuretic peptide 2 [Colossoma macropomum]
MASSSSHLLLLILILCITMATQVASRPSPRKPDSQILNDLFGSEISSLLLAQPDITEGSAQSPAPPETKRSGLPARSVGAEPHRAVPRLFLDFLSRQRKLRGRSRKSPARGCFGMKVDRIGALSGLGC